MFGSSKKSAKGNVKLTGKQLKALKKNMSAKELKEFNKRQKQVEEDRFLDAIAFAESMLDD